MAAVWVPSAVWWTTERFAPGAYFDFWSRLLLGVSRDTRATSYWRGPDENARVGGSPDSQHLVGLAMDLVDPAPASLAADLNARGLRAFQYQSHVHVQLWEAGHARRVGLLAALGL